MMKLIFGGLGICVLAGALLRPELTCCMPAGFGKGLHAGTPSGSSADSPLYCNLRAYTPEQRKHKAELDNAFNAIAQAYRELPDGYEFRFPGDQKSVQLMTEWVAMERLCCPFFDMDLRLAREGGSFWLRLTGRQGVKEFIAADFQMIKNHLIPKE